MASNIEGTAARKESSAPVEDAQPVHPTASLPEDSSPQTALMNLDELPAAPPSPPRDPFPQQPTERRTLLQHRPPPRRAAVRAPPRLPTLPSLQTELGGSSGATAEPSASTTEPGGSMRPPMLPIDETERNLVSDFAENLRSRAPRPTRGRNPRPNSRRTRRQPPPPQATTPQRSLNTQPAAPKQPQQATENSRPARTSTTQRGKVLAMTLAQRLAGLPVRGRDFTDTSFRPSGKRNKNGHLPKSACMGTPPKGCGEEEWSKKFRSAESVLSKQLLDKNEFESLRDQGWVHDRALHLWKKEKKGEKKGEEEDEDMEDAEDDEDEDNDKDMTGV